MHPNIPVIYEDSQILVVDKPTGIISEDLPAGRQVFLAHRLDKDTSGVIVIAKTEEVLANLQEQFRGRGVKKEYIALVHGKISEFGLIDAPIARNPKIYNRFVIDKAGKLAATKYEIVKQFDGYTLLNCFPLTGRTHQIRVHLKYINHPIVSDSQYVGRKIYKLDVVWCPRQFLHAAKIGFNHPETGKWVEFESPLPEDLKKVLWTMFSYNLQ